MEVPNHPQKPEMGTRNVSFSRVLFIEQDDFMENPIPKFFRLGPGREVRLRSAYLVKCVGFTKDPSTGIITEVRCEYDPASRGGTSPDGRKVKGTLHWVSEAHSWVGEVRLYDRFFSVPFPGQGGADYVKQINPNSLQVLKECRLESRLGAAKAGEAFQFERQGYFCGDSRESMQGRPVFNRTVTLRDSWAKERVS